MLQNLEAIGCLGAQSSSLTTPLSATQQGDRYHVLTGTTIIGRLNVLKNQEDISKKYWLEAKVLSVSIYSGNGTDYSSKLFGQYSPPDLATNSQRFTSL